MEWNGEQIMNNTPWRRHLWPWLLMLGPIAVICAGSYTSWLAFTRQDALVVDDYYRQGKAINQDLRRNRAAAELGLSLNLRYDPAQNHLHGRLLSHGKSIAGTVRLNLIHPTRPEWDIALHAQLGRNGAFSISLPDMERARWKIQVEDEYRNWRLQGAWQWPQQQRIVFE